MSHAGDLEWINDYVGVPYLENGRDRDGWDCWGLVLAVYRERLALELPDWRWAPPYTALEKLRAFEEGVDQADELVAELEAPEEFALGLVRAERRAHHIGIAVGGGVLHAQRYGGTVWEPLARWQSNYPRVKWHRWRR